MPTVRNPKYKKRLKKAEACRDQVWRSDALESIHAAFGKNWVSAVTYLERRYPGEFSLKNVNRDDPLAGQPVGNQVTLETLIEDAKIAAEIALQKPIGLPASEAARE